MPSIQITEYKIKVACVTVLATIFLSLLVSLGIESEHGVMLLQGDFPGFYAIGKIFLSGRYRELYNWELQRDIQNLYWPNLQQRSLVTFYPPIVAFLMMPIAFIPAMISKVLCSIILLFLLVISLNLQTNDKKLERFTLMIISAPILISIVATQNTVVMIMLLILGFKNHEKNRELFAGFILGLLLYKPQIGIITACLFLPLLNISLLNGFAISGIFQFGIGASTIGLDWIELWADGIRNFGRTNLLENGYQMTSLLNYFIRTNDSHIVPFLYIPIATTLVLLLIKIYLSKNNLPKTLNLIYLSPSLMFIFLPYIMFYDLGIPLFFALTKCRLDRTKDYIFPVATIIATNLCILLKDQSMLMVPLATVIIFIFSKATFK